MAVDERDPTDTEQLAQELARGPAWDKKLFPLWQKYGFHITPNHFYQPVPDTSMLPDSLWDTPSEMAGIDINEAGQLDFLASACEPFKTEYDRFPQEPTGASHEFHFGQLMFRMVDAEVLYCVIRHFKPARIVEIGSGYSTLLAAAACRRNLEEGHRTRLVCIEPFPSDFLRAGVPGVDELVEQRVEMVDRKLFSDLAANDILFIDSSHVLRIGNDVYFEYLEVLPKLAQGVLVHIHDIFLPYQYPKQWILEHNFFWTEQYLLQAFLAFNSAFRVIWAGCYMHRKHEERLKKAFASYDPASTLPGSFWMKKTN